MTDLVTIYTLYDSMEAELIRARLDAAGVWCLLKSDDGGGTLPHLTASNGIQVVVSEKDAVRACELLQQKDT